MYICLAIPHTKIRFFFFCTFSKRFDLFPISETLRKLTNDRLSNLLKNFGSRTSKNIPITNINHVERKPNQLVSAPPMQPHRIRHDHIIGDRPNTVVPWTTAAVPNYLRQHHRLTKITKNRMRKRFPPTTIRMDYIIAS